MLFFKFSRTKSIVQHFKHNFSKTFNKLKPFFFEYETKIINVLSFKQDLQ